MPHPKQLEFFPQKRPSAQERRAIIRQRLEGLEYRQLAREQRRRDVLTRRRQREAGSTADASNQVTLDEMIARLCGPAEAP